MLLPFRSPQATPFEGGFPLPHHPVTILALPSVFPPRHLSSHEIILLICLSTACVLHWPASLLENAPVLTPHSTPLCSTQQAPSYAHWVSVRTLCQVKWTKLFKKLPNSFAKMIDGMLNKIWPCHM